VTTTSDWLTSVAIAAGNTLEGVVGAWLVLRYARGAATFERAGDFFRFALLAAIAATTISATIGVTSLAFAGAASLSSYGSIWLTWWLGDATGALLVAPPIVLWARAGPPRYDRVHALEAVLMLVTAVIVSFGLFGGSLELIGLSRYPLAFLTMPVLMWAAFRFGPREASGLILITSAIATWGTVRGVSSLVVAGPNESLLVLQSFMATIAGLTMPTAALVAESARANVRLRASELTYRAMFELNPLPMWVVDLATRRFLAVNDAAVRFYGYTREEFAAMTSDEIRPPDDLPRLRSAQAQLRGGKPYFGRHRHRTKHGRDIDVEVTAHVIDFDGRPATLILAYDITERLRAAERERRALEEAEAANVAKDEFLATLSHELRTPLNAILGWASMLRARQLGPEESARALDTIERNSRLQVRLIEDLLDVSRIVADKLVLDTRTVELWPIVEAATDAIRPSADAKSIAIERALDPTTPHVIGDPARLEQIAFNLLSNAVKFTPAGGHVIVRLSPARRAARLEVTDTGQGIPVEFLPHVFDRFRQADTTPTRRHTGLGLGLTIVRHLVSAHGGTVHASSSGEGCGATFVVELPAVSAPMTEPPRTPPPAAHDVLRGLRVLVVDDDADNRQLAATILECAGAETVTADSGPRASGARGRTLRRARRGHRHAGRRWLRPGSLRPARRRNGGAARGRHHRVRKQRRTSARRRCRLRRASRETRRARRARRHRRRGCQASHHGLGSAPWSRSPASPPSRRRSTCRTSTPTASSRRDFSASRRARRATTATSSTTCGSPPTAANVPSSS
jgi:PAS domain S-box-containing protein